jgi:hypothetical protein
MPTLQEMSVWIREFGLVSINVIIFIIGKEPELP